jgi:hypothetical protein
VILATVDAGRAMADLEPLIGSDWHEAGTDAALGAACHRTHLGRGELVLAEPTSEGYVAACLARWGEGPIAIALDGNSGFGRIVTDNPITDGPAVWVRLGTDVAPSFLFLPAA